MIRREFIQQVLAAGAVSQTSRGQAPPSSAAPIVERSNPNQPHKGKVLLAIQAHSDDIPLSAAGTVAKLIEEGYTGYLIRATNDDMGDAPGLGTPGTIGEHVLGNERDNAEVARAAVLLDGVKHMVLTTGTPPTPDRGAQVLVDSAFAIRAAVDIPIQAQCEPPDTDHWFVRMKAAGVDTLGMHLETVTPEVRERVMPGKASVPLARYMESFEAAVGVFGRGQVSTYILAGLGDSREAILAMCERLVAIGVYPFVVPFVPISGTPLEDHPAPTPEFMRSVLEPLGAMVWAGGMRSGDIKAGCGKCGACSSLSVYER